MATRFKTVAPAPVGDDSSWRDLYRRLAATGFVRIPAGPRQTPPEIRVADDFVERLVVSPGTPPPTDGLARRLGRLMAAGRRVTLGLSAPGAGQPDLVAAREQIGRLATCVAGLGQTFAPAAIAVPAEWPDYARIVEDLRSACDGLPDVFAVLPPDLLEAVQRKDLLARPGVTPLPARARWSDLLEQAAADPRVHLVPGDTAAPADPLLECRAMHAPEPALAQPATSGGARVRIEIDLPGLIRETRCRPALVEGLCHDLVRLADGLLDGAQWPSRELAVRAATRRRIALHLRELGEAAVLLGGRPGGLAALRRLGALLALMGDAARSASRRLAGHAPAPGCGAPGAPAPVLRHAHLLVWRPWDFLPPGPETPSEQEAYSHLFPLMRLADCPGWRRRGIEDAGLYGRLLRLAWASWRLR